MLSVAAKKKNIHLIGKSPEDPIARSSEVPTGMAKFTNRSRTAPLSGHRDKHKVSNRHPAGEVPAHKQFEAGVEVDYGTDYIAAVSNTDLEVVHNTGKIASPRGTVVDTVALGNYCNVPG